MFDFAQRSVLAGRHWQCGKKHGVMVLSDAASSSLRWPGCVLVSRFGLIF
jgi:hypothetical protein